MNTNHDWYYQIQGQLHITNKKNVYWQRKKQTKNASNRKKNDDFWEKKMKNKLEQFYMKCYLPELNDPRT
jgi:hypothetical protein